MSVCAAPAVSLLSPCAGRVACPTDVYFCSCYFHCTYSQFLRTGAARRLWEASRRLQWGRFYPFGFLLLLLWVLSLDEVWLACHYVLSMQSRGLFQTASQRNVWTGCAHSLSLNIKLALRRAHTNCRRRLNLSSRLQNCLWSWLKETRLLSWATTNFLFVAFWCNCLFPLGGKPVGMFSWLVLVLFFF